MNKVDVFERWARESGAAVEVKVSKDDEYASTTTEILARNPQNRHTIQFITCKREPKQGRRTSERITAQMIYRWGTTRRLTSLEQAGTALSIMMGKL